MEPSAPPPLRLSDLSPRPWRPPAGRPARILIVRLSALGDVIHALPMAAALRRRFPNAHIAWAVEDRAADLLRLSQDLDEVHVFARKSLSKDLRRGRIVATAREAVRWIGSLRAPRFDLAIDLQGNLKSGIVTRSSGAACRYGWDRAIAKEGNQVFSHRRWRPEAQVKHKVLRNLGLLEVILNERVEYVAPSLHPTDSDRKKTQSILSRVQLDASPYVVLHPGTSGFGSFKRWPADRWSSLARSLASKGHAVVLSHTPPERPLIDSIVEGAPDAMAVSTRSLGAFTVLLERAALFVSADTGPLHLAALVQTPVLGLYGPKDPGIYGPFGLRDDASLGLLPTLTQDDVACRPCSLRRCSNPLCMNTMSPARVMTRCLEFLS